MGSISLLQGHSLGAIAAITAVFLGAPEAAIAPQLFSNSPFTSSQFKALG